eukprot:COSAG02_NODE_41798_length_390_cov_9430.037801_1_plen_87_part_10
MRSLTCIGAAGAKCSPHVLIKRVSSGFVLADDEEALEASLHKSSLSFSPSYTALYRSDATFFVVRLSLELVSRNGRACVRLVSESGG